MFRFGPLTFVSATAVLLLLIAPGWGQRVQFPSTPSGGSGTATPPPTYGSGGAYSPPGGYSTYPAAASGGAAPPPAAFQGGIAPAPTWDAYSSPSDSPFGSPPAYPAAPSYPQAPPALFPEGVGGFMSGSTTGVAPGHYAAIGPTGTLEQWPRFFKEVRAEYTWLTGDGGNSDFEMSTAELSTTANFAFLYQQAPLQITPGFAAHFLEGPVSQPPLMNGAPLPTPFPADLPPRLFDAYLDAAWKPQITPFLSADLGARIGVYSDFDHFTDESVRIMGRGLGVLTFSPRLKIALGVVYFDRLNVKLLPAGGAIWTPNEDTRWEILFPRPKLAKRLTTIGTTDWWWYVAGEYGGGTWTVQRRAVALDTDDPDALVDFTFNGKDVVEYSDLRAILGLEFRGLSGLRGLVEVGYVFDREIFFKSRLPSSFVPDDTFMLRGGLAY